MSSVTRSCLECRRRKIRCDRDYPCSYCTKIGGVCVYPHVEKLTRRQRTRAIVAPESSAESAGLLDRIAALEQRVQQLDGRLAEVEFEGWFNSADVSPNTGFLPTPASPQDQILRSTQLLLNPPDPTSIPRSLELTKTGVACLPDINILQSVWATYLTDIDPLLKLVDHNLVEDMLLAFPTIPNEGRSLLTTIFFAVKTKECVSITDYRALVDAVETSFQAAKVLTQPRLSTLQALTLYLTCGRVNMDQDYLRNKLSLLVQLAKKLQLDRDPAELGYMTEECEHRRRLWWHIVSLDVRTAEACSTDCIIQRNQMSTKLPSRTVLNNTPRSNICLKTEQHDTCFAVVAIEMADLAKRFLFKADTDMDKAALTVLSDQAHQDLLAKHNCNCCACSDSPLCRLTEEWCKIYRARQYLLILHGDKAFLKHVTLEVDTAQAENTLHIAADILERIQALKRDENYSRWAWLWQNCVEWDVTAIALSIIAGGKCSATSVTRAWTAIDCFFSEWKPCAFGDPKHQKRWNELCAFQDLVRFTGAMAL